MIYLIKTIVILKVVSNLVDSMKNCLKLSKITAFWKGLCSYYKDEAALELLSFFTNSLSLTQLCGCEHRVLLLASSQLF